MQNAASTDLRDTGSLDDFIGPRSAGTYRCWASKQLSGKRVLITGAGGSIGSALARAVWAAAPAGLVLLDASENGLYQVDRSLHEAGSHRHIPLLSSVSNHTALSHLFEQHQPQIIFHAAALKHVPLMEQNPFAAIENNASVPSPSLKPPSLIASNSSSSSPPTRRSIRSASWARPSASPNSSCSHSTQAVLT